LTIKRCLFWALISWLLFACTPDRDPGGIAQTSTVSIPRTPSPTLDSTPASPLTRTWEVGPVLLEFKTLFEDSAPFGVSRTPDLILYSDGRLVVRTNAGFRAAQLSRQEICTLLNTIDQVGFYDFDMAPYHEQMDELPLGIASTTVIEVNAWKQRAVVAMALRDIVDDSTFQVPSPLRSVYLLLSDYRPADLQPYQYDQLALTIHQPLPDSPYKTETRWPLSSPSLGELFERAEQANIKNREGGFGLLLEGETAASVYQAIRQIPGRGFVEDGEMYIVAARPLWPYESLESAVSYEAEIPSPGVETRTIALTCYDADGVLEIP
jgi:hypothetical protein